MEPRREEQKALQPVAAPQPIRFRIVKLEERIAPTNVQPKGGTYTCYPGSDLTCGRHCTHQFTLNPGHCK
jgi:hypothetical protein